MRIAVIGSCGHSGAALDGIKSSKGRDVLCAVSGAPEDNTARLKERAAELNPSAAYYPDYCEMLDKEKPDICVVDNVFYKHKDAAVASLSRGIPTYCEKPLAMDLQGLGQVEAAAGKTGVLLWAMQTARYDPWFYTAYQLIKQGAIGDVLMLNAQKSYRLGNRAAHYRKRKTYGGTIPWVAIHSLDLIRFLSGVEPNTVYAFHSTRCNCGHGDLESYGQILMKLDNGIAASVNFDFLRPESAPTHGDDRVRVLGSEGVLEVRGNRVYLIDKNGESEPPLLRPKGIWDAFLAAVSGQPGLLTTADSIASTRAALTARESADKDCLLRL